AGLEACARDPRFDTNADRVAHREELLPLIEERLRQRTRAEWLALFEAEGIPAGPIQQLDEAFSDPQVLARGMLAEVEHPTAGRVKMTGIPAKLSETPGRVAVPPPLLGEQTESILASLGYSDSEIAALLRDGVVRSAELPASVETEPDAGRRPAAGGR